jgi:drug/metabolite transporter (DMT)-like permease
MTSHGERVALAAFVTQAVLAGGNAVCIRFSNRELAPLWGAGLRFSLAAALLLAAMAVLRLPFPRGRALIGSVLYGLFNFGLSFALIYYGLVRVQVGLGQILLALVPLATLLLAVLWRQERVRGSAVIGTFFALVGITLIALIEPRDGIARDRGAAEAGRGGAEPDGGILRSRDTTRRTTGSGIPAAASSSPISSRSRTAPGKNELGNPRVAVVSYQCGEVG